jgi:(2Fe-2S) ferredoxin
MNSRLFVGNDVIISGRLNVQEYTQSNIIYTNVTSTNYTLIVAEDMSLNGNMTVSGTIYSTTPELTVIVTSVFPAV